MKITNNTLGYTKTVYLHSISGDQFAKGDFHSFPGGEKKNLSNTVVDA